jgi:hypothetical protein
LHYRKDFSENLPDQSGRFLARARHSVFMVFGHSGSMNAQIKTKRITVKTGRKTINNRDHYPIVLEQRHDNGWYYAQIRCRECGESLCWNCYSSGRALDRTGCCHRCRMHFIGGTFEIQ